MVHQKKRTWSIQVWDYSALPPCGFVFSVNGTPHVGYPAERGRAQASDLQALIRAARHMAASSKTPRISSHTEKPFSQETGEGL